MNVQQKNKQNGFTIIEVVLVLAIAGLIFLMVFIALPALQRNQRDTQRRDDMSRMSSQLNSYATNNRGDLPNPSNSGEMSRFMESYMRVNEGEFRDPQTGENYTVSTSDPTTSRVQYVINSECDGEAIRSVSGNRRAAVRIQLEGSGTFCQNVH